MKPDPEILKQETAGTDYARVSKLGRMFGLYEASEAQKVIGLSYASKSHGRITAYVDKYCTRGLLKADVSNVNCYGTVTIVIFRFFFFFFFFFVGTSVYLFINLHKTESVLDNAKQRKKIKEL